jgi:NADPH-dependent curcumin reductase
MQSLHLTNRRILLNARPQGAPQASDFRLERSPVPAPEPGQVLLRTLLLSLDPYMRGRMGSAASYAPPIELGAVMVGSTISRVAASAHPDFHEGDLVCGASGWQDYALSDGQGLRTLPHGAEHPSHWLGVRGLTGFTAYAGLLNIGRPQRGETLVVGAASGPVGSVVGQLALSMGCTVVGVAGSEDKCQYVRDELKFTQCLNHHHPELPAALAAACPMGIDVYFENVGGATLNAVLPLLNPGARIPLCGLAAQYNADGLTSATAQGPDRLPQLMATLLRRRVHLQGFIAFDDFGAQFPTFFAAMGDWLASGEMQVREDTVVGLENAPEAFIGLLQGRNFGKLLIEVAGD